MSFTLPNLPYSHDALESLGMSRETLEFHHDMHHKAYVDNGNKLLEGTPFKGKNLEQIIRATYGNEEYTALFNNASQHWNHTHFWQMMSPKKMGIPEKLQRYIDDSFGSFDAFSQQFIQAGVSQFGSGWCWLVFCDGRLKVTKTPNGINPLCYEEHTLLGCDVWEHSYYIDYRNRRPGYVENFVNNLVNWEYVESCLATALDLS